MNAADIERTLSGYRFQGYSEADLQDGVEQALADAGVFAVREARLGPGERVDFLTDTGVAIEIKTASSTTPADVLRQVQRYARHRDVVEILVVSTRAKHTLIPAMAGGKPCRALWLRGIG